MIMQFKVHQLSVFSMSSIQNSTPTPSHPSVHPSVRPSARRGGLSCCTASGCLNHSRGSVDRGGTEELAEHHTGNWPSSRVHTDAVVRIPEETEDPEREEQRGGNNKRREKERDPTSAKNFRGLTTLPRPQATDCQARMHRLC